MVELSDIYPERVTRGEDGIYRWSYDMDMWKNHFLLGFLLKLMGMIGGGLYVVMLLIFSFEYGMASLLTAVVLLGIPAGLLLLMLVIYCIWVLAKQGHNRVYFEMSDVAVSLVRPPSTMKYMKAASAVSAVAAVASVATGNFAQGAMLGGNAIAASTQAIEGFGSVRRIKEHRKYDAMNLVGILHSFQVWVPKEDYLFVKEHIEAGMRGKVKS